MFRGSQIKKTMGPIDLSLSNQFQLVMWIQFNLWPIKLNWETWLSRRNQVKTWIILRAIKQIIRILVYINNSSSSNNKLSLKLRFLLISLDWIYSITKFLYLTVNVAKVLIKTVINNKEIRTSCACLQCLIARVRTAQLQLIKLLSKETIMLCLNFLYYSQVMALIKAIALTMLSIKWLKLVRAWPEIIMAVVNWWMQVRDIRDKDKDCSNSSQLIKAITSFREVSAIWR